ncbi:MAG: F0F1 ATP synthase subunit delta [FCB group bacterium]|nr:F0F1 ATP synthase subunit delta [FCB group bacterium]
MLSQVVAQRYAHALFLATEEKKLIDVAYEQLNALKRFITEDATMLNFLSAPQILEEDKHALIRKIFTDRLNRLFVEFMIVLVNKHRINYLAEIIDEFIRMVEAKQGLGRVTVITAVALNDDESQKLIEKMAEKTGLNIVLEKKVDPSIIGGMIVVLHDEVIDGSIRHQLEAVDEQLEKVRVH